jgi:hypothetical protein
MIVGALAAAIFLAVAGAGWFTVRELHEYSSKLVEDTLPGLVDTGLAGERMHDNRHTMHEMLFPHTAAERAQMIEQVKTNSTDALWQDYTASIFEPADRQNYQTAMLTRSNYLQGCNQFLDLVSAGKIDEATVLFNGDLSQRFQRYNAAAKNLFDYNMWQGIGRGKIILETATYAPWVIAGVCVLMFGFGLLLGLRLVLSGAKLNRRQPGP